MEFKHNGGEQLFKIPNDAEGEYFLYLMNKYMNKDKYSYRRRGRGIDNKQLKKDCNGNGEYEMKRRRLNYDGNKPKRYATHFSIYLTDKKKKIITSVQPDKIREQWNDMWDTKDKLRKIQKIVEE